MCMCMCMYAYIYTEYVGLHGIIRVPKKPGLYWIHCDLPAVETQLWRSRGREARRPLAAFKIDSVSLVRISLQKRQTSAKVSFARGAKHCSASVVSAVLL